MRFDSQTDYQSIAHVWYSWSMKAHNAKVSCPFCSVEQEHSLYPIIDLEAKPALKLGILTDSIFTVTCISCKKQFEVTHEMLVLDNERGFALLLAPDSTLQELDGSSIHEQNLEDHTLRLVTTTDELKEKILLLEGGLEDCTIELCKLYLLMQMGKDNYTLLFSDHQVVEGQLLFSVFDEQGELQGTIQCQDSLYTQLLETTKHFPVKKGVFTRINQTWAYEQIKKNAE